MSYRYAAVAAVLAALACPGPTIRDSWVAQDFQKTSVRKVLVLGIATQPSVRRSFEDRFAAELRARGCEAVAGWLWVPDAAAIDKEAVRARIEAEGVTHVLATRLVATREVERKKSSSPIVLVDSGAPEPPGSWPAYVKAGYGEAGAPPSSTAGKVVTLETNLYDAARAPGEALVWTGRTETWVDGPATDAKIGSVIASIVSRMRADGVL